MPYTPNLQTPRCAAQLPFKGGLHCQLSPPAVRYSRVCLSCKDPPHHGLPQQPTLDPTLMGSIHPGTPGQGDQHLCGPTSQLTFSPCPVLFPVPPCPVAEPAEHTESDPRHCEVCRSPCHYCQTINPRNPGAETGMPLEAPEATLVVLHVLASRSRTLSSNKSLCKTIKQNKVEIAVAGQRGLGR